MSGDYIELYPHALDPRACAELIGRFEASGMAARGRSASGVDLRMKDSWDLCIDDHPEWRDAVNLLNTVMMGALVRYVRKYPYTMLGPLTLRRKDPASGAERLINAEDLQGLADSALQGLLASMFRPGTINLQKYIADEGGYPGWHCEQYPEAGDASCEALARRRGIASNVGRFLAPIRLGFRPGRQCARRPALFVRLAPWSDRPYRMPTRPPARRGWAAKINVIGARRRATDKGPRNNNFRCTEGVPGPRQQGALRREWPVPLAKKRNAAGVVQGRPNAGSYCCADPKGRGRCAGVRRRWSRCSGCRWRNVRPGRRLRESSMLAASWLFTGPWALSPQDRVVLKTSV
jgi:hypothetical protein